MRILRRPAFALLLGATLVLGGCQNPDGSPNVGGTLALGLGAVLATGLVVAASNKQGRSQNYDTGRYRRGGYDPSYGNGYGRGYGHGYGNRGDYRGGRGRW